MGVLFDRCQNCGSTKTNSGLLSGLCPNCGEERELVIGPGGDNYGEGTENSRARLRKVAEGVRETVVKTKGTEEGVMTVDEMMSTLDRSKQNPSQ